METQLKGKETLAFHQGERRGSLQAGCSRPLPIETKGSPLSPALPFSELRVENLLGREGEGTPRTHMVGKESRANGIVSSAQEGTDAGQAVRL